MKPRFLRITFVIIVVLVLGLLLSITLQLELPAPTGPYAVGQTVFRWVDHSRPESLTETPDDFREVIAVLWYPAEAGTGVSGSYFPALSHVSKALADSGEVESWEVFGLRFLRSKNRLDAKVAQNTDAYPVVILSPGNGTNVEFYGTLASELASHGYIVVGVNHPYDVAAVELSDGSVAEFNKIQESLSRSENAAYVAERIEVRTADVIFALNQLENLNTSADSPFAGRLDVEEVAVTGHSLGGITASEACKTDARFRACLNYDGLQRGGPFSTEETALPPQQPFMFLTKESQLPPKWLESFESTSQSYWIVIQGASHDSFTDGPLLQLSLLPIPGHADQIAGLIQKYTLAFLDQTLRGQPSDLLSASTALQDVSVRVYPSH